MKHATYIGQVLELWGKTALVRQVSLGGYPMLQAQFDDQQLQCWSPVTHQYINLGHGWHLFPVEDFRLDDEGDQPATEKDTMRYTNDISRPLDGADNLNISVAVPGIPGTHRWRVGRNFVDGKARLTFDALLRYLIDLDLEEPLQSALLVPDLPPGGTVLAVIRHEERAEPRSVRFEPVTCLLQPCPQVTGFDFSADDGA